MDYCSRSISDLEHVSFSLHYSIFCDIIDDQVFSNVTYYDAMLGIMMMLKIKVSYLTKFEKSGGYPITQCRLHFNELKSIHNHQDDF